MITIRDDTGTATYYLDPYPHWDGDDETADRGEALRARVDTELVARGLDTSANDRSQQIHKAFVTALVSRARNTCTIQRNLVPSDACRRPRTFNYSRRTGMP